MTSFAIFNTKGEQMETMNLNCREAYKKMTEASNDWSEWAEKAIILDEGRKAMFSKLFLKYKLDTKTVGEAAHKARTDPEYKEIIKSYGNRYRRKITI